jgi:transposase-like protein
MIELMRSGRTPVDLARQFGVSDETLRMWRRLDQAANGRKDGHSVAESKEGLTPDEKAELVRLRREVSVLREERDILSKATAWFAQEVAPTPKKRFDS